MYPPGRAAPAGLLDVPGRGLVCRLGPLAAVGHVQGLVRLDPHLRGSQGSVLIGTDEQEFPLLPVATMFNLLSDLDRKSVV